jgi:hypothetical protein
MQLRAGLLHSQYTLLKGAAKLRHRLGLSQPEPENDDSNGDDVSRDKNETDNVECHWKLPGAPQ